MIMTTVFTIMFALFTNTVRCKIFSHTDSSIGIAINIDIGPTETTVQVDTTFTGAFSVGFGGLDMSGTYAIAQESTLIEGTLSRAPRALNPISGSQDNVNWIVDSDVSQASTRTVILRRPNACASCFTFDPTATSLQIVYAQAKNNGASFSSGHLASSRDFATVAGSDTTQPTTNPTTNAPTTQAPTTPSPTTAAPTTTAPTKAPLPAGQTATPSLMPTTQQPTTAEPTTSPTTSAPTTAVPTLGGGFEVCVDTTELIAGSGVTVQIARDSATQTMMKIKMSGPNTKWFAYGFGSLVMPDTYALSVEGETATVVERILGDYTSGTDLFSFVGASDIGSTRVVEITRPYAYGNAFDFTHLLTCEVDAIDAISAYGFDLAFDTHFDRASGTLQRVCQCDTSGTTTNTTNTTATPTAAITATATAEAEAEAQGCDKQDLLPTPAVWDDFEVDFFINCADDTVSVTIAYPGFDDNWFGIVFADTMIGDALVYTTGADGANEAGLYPYSIAGRRLADIQLELDAAADNVWTKVGAEDVDGVFTVQYSAQLDESPFSRDTESVTMRWARGTTGSGLLLSAHSAQSGTGFADSSRQLQLLAGTSSIVADDLTLASLHGAIMWLTWAVLASWAIMSSAFRWLYPKGAVWFKIHQGVQILVVLLCLVGFMIALVFTAAKTGKPHFDNIHAILGLVVTILTVLQPFNAMYRAHPPADGWPNGRKPIKRIVWEFVHKGFGYLAWILACVVIVLGLRLLAKQLLVLLHCVWCGLLLVVYVVLKCLSCLNAKKQKETATVNANMNNND